MTPHQRASTHVVAAWEGCYSQMFGSAVASEERAIKAEAEVARLMEALDEIETLALESDDFVAHAVLKEIAAVVSVDAIRGAL